MKIVSYDEYYVTICRSNDFLLDGILWKLKPAWDEVSDWFVQPIAEQLTMLMKFTLIFTIEMFDYVICKKSPTYAN